MSSADRKRGAVTRLQALEYVLDEQRRRGYLAHAGSLGASAAAADRAVDEAIVAVFGAGVPGDLVMADTLVRLEIARVLGSPPAKPPAAAALAPETRRPVLVRRIRRRRARRIGAITGVATLAVALTVGAALAVGQIERTPAAGLPDGPEPSVGGSSPSASPEPKPLGDVTEHSLLPDAEPLLEGMLEEAGPGWSLVQYATEALDGDSLVYLVDPDGALYEVPDSERLPGRLVDWLPGSTLALFRTGRYAGEEVVVDLVTQQQFVTVHESLADDHDAHVQVAFVGDGTTDLVAAWSGSEDGAETVLRTVRLGLDGTERAAAGPYPSMPQYSAGFPVSLDGSRLVAEDSQGLRVVATDGLTDLARIPNPGGGFPCDVNAWLTDDQLAVVCGDPDSEAEVDQLWLVPADGGKATFLGQTPYPTAWLVGGMTVVRASDDEGLVLYRARGDGDLARLDADLPWVVSGSADGRLFGHTPEYEAIYWDDELVSVDPFTGDRRVLLASDAEHSAIRSVVTINDSGRATRGDY